MTIAALSDRVPAAAGIRLDRIGVEYIGKRGRVRALSGVSLSIAPGEFIAIVGRSGSGKSTLLRVLGGLIPSSEGEARLHGQPIAGPPASVRFVAQDYTQSLLPWRTVGGNVDFGARHAVKASGDHQATVERVLELVGLSHAASRYPRELSGGMQQRVAIARALASSPDILLLDEAFGSVDALSRARLQDMILQLWSTLRFTAVLVTHDIDEAVYLADRVLVVDEKGRGIAANVRIDLPRPRHQVRTRELARYLQHRRELMDHVLSLETNEETSR